MPRAKKKSDPKSPIKGEEVAEKAKRVEKTVEAVVDEVAKDLKIGPETKANERWLPFGIRLVTLLTLLGGLAILGNAFADNYLFRPIDISFYIFRLVMGLLLILIAYGLHRRRLYAIWILGLALIPSFFANPLLAIFPALILAYLYRNRSYFRKMQEFKIGKMTFKV